MRELLVVFVWLLPAVAWAQTTGQNVLPLIAQYESSGNPTAQNSGSTSSGLYGMLNSTWAQALEDCGCGTTAQFANEASAPASTQSAAAAALINSQGLSPWTCANCDAPFTAALADEGGASAFQTSGLSTDPTDYSSLDTTAGLSSFMGTTGTAGTAGLTVSTTGSDLTTSGTTGGVTVAPPLGSTTTAAAGSTSMTPFSLVWNDYESVMAGPISTDIGNVLTTAAQPLGLFLLLDMLVMGCLIAVGMNNFNNLWRRLFKIMVVIALVGAANIYQSDFVSVVTSLPTWLNQGLGISGNALGPAGNFDKVSAAFLSAVHTAWAQVPWGSEMFLDAGMFAIAFVIMYGAEIIMFGVWFVAQVITQILLVIGPFMALTLLSEYLSDIFVRYIKTLLLMVVVSFIVNFVTVLALQVMTALIGAISPSAVAGTLIAGVFGAAIAVAAIASAVVVLPRVIEGLAGAAGAPNMAAAQNALRAVVSHIPGVGTGAASAATTVGSSSSTAYGPARSVTPPGRSLS
jgi:hypothetical protein